MMYEIVNCIDNDAEYICDKLVEYNLSQVPKTQEIEFKNINKKIVDEKYRKCGLGTRLLSEIEEIALKENCSLIHLDTFDFQARDFYIKQGYEIFGVLEHCPENHYRYYLKKELK